MVIVFIAGEEFKDSPLNIVKNNIFDIIIIVFSRTNKE